MTRICLLALSLVGAALAAGSASGSTERILSGLSAPIFAAAPAGDTRLFVLERAGRVLVWDGAQLLPTPFLDISDRVFTAGEGGLLGIAFAPDYAASRAFYVYYTVEGPGPLLPLTVRLSRFRASTGDPDVADPAEKVLFELDEFDEFHNGGTIAFDLDGMLYLGLGDGGDANDAQEVAQRGDSLLGKMLRLDVSFSSFDDDYAVPPDNPFVGDPTVLDEIWSLGLRNPFRFSFDRQTGDLYIGDVGQGSFEEIDVEPRPDPGAPAPANPGGRNYGWDVMEGTSCFETPDPGEPPCNDPSLTLPIHEYSHTAGLCSVTGGVVVRRPGLLFGEYLFGDYCSGRLFSLVWDGAGGTVGPVEERTALLAPDAGSIDFPVAFGEGGSGEVYVVDIDGEVFLVPEPGAVLRFGIGALVLAGAAWRRRAGAGRREREGRAAAGAPGP